MCVRSSGGSRRRSKRRRDSCSSITSTRGVKGNRRLSRCDLSYSPTRRRAGGRNLQGEKGRGSYITPTRGVMWSKGSNSTTSSSPPPRGREGKRLLVRRIKDR